MYLLYTRMRIRVYRCNMNPTPRVCRHEYAHTCIYVPTYSGIDVYMYLLYTRMRIRGYRCNMNLVPWSTNIHCQLILYKEPANHLRVTNERLRVTTTMVVSQIQKPLQNRHYNIPGLYDTGAFEICRARHGPLTTT